MFSQRYAFVYVNIVHEVPRWCCLKSKTPSAYVDIFLIHDLQTSFRPDPNYPTSNYWEQGKNEMLRS